MKPELLPPIELAAFQDESTKVVPSKVRGARSIVWCSQPLQPAKAAYQGAVYKDDGAMLGSVPFETMSALFKAALGKGAPLRSIELAGTRKKKELQWEARALGEEEWKALRGALAQPHERVVEAMRKAKTQHQTPLQLTIGASSRLKLRSLVLRFSAWAPNQDLPVGEDLSLAVADLRVGYAQRGFSVSGNCNLLDEGPVDMLALAFLPKEDEDAVPVVVEPAPSRDAEWGMPGSQHPIVASWLACRELLRQFMPDLYQNLAGPASLEKLIALEKVVGQHLPESVTALLACNDGQRVEQPGVVFGLRLLSCGEIEEVLREWAEVRATLGRKASDLKGRALTPGVRSDYSRAGWIPLFADSGRADYFGVDLDPAKGGVAGQVINFGRNEGDKYVAASRLEGFLDGILDWCKQHTQGGGVPGWVGEVEGNSCVLFNHFHHLAENRGKSRGKKAKPQAKRQGKSKASKR